MKKNEIIIPGQDKEQNKKEKENDIEKELALAKEEEKFILSSIIFKKYKPIKRITQSNYSLIYEGINIQNGEKVAIKLESRKIPIENQLLQNEIFYLYMLRHIPGIVKMESTGHTKDYNILIEPLLGPTLYNLFLDKNINFTLKDICLIALQCIERLESVHNKSIIHCDIKPENFLIGSKDKRVIYLIDFGLSRKYRSDRTKKHIQFSITKTMIGTARYASMNALSGLQLSRRDDLESLCYVILYFLTKKLPWQGIKAETVDKRYKKIYKKKAELEQWEKFKLIPKEIQCFVKYCRNLGFAEEPNYKLMKNYFYELLDKSNFEVDNNFSWIIDKSIIGSKMPVLFPRKKYSAMYKLMDKIEKKKMSLSVGNNINHNFIFNNINKEEKKRTNSPNNIKIKLDEDVNNKDKENDSESEKNNSSVKAVQQYKLDNFSDEDEEFE